MSSTFSIVNCRFSPQYHQESHSGRCLFNKDYFFSSESKLKVGCIVKISLETCGTIVMCTAWPDLSHNTVLPFHTLILDAMVIVSSIDKQGMLKCLWTDCPGNVSI